MGALQILILNPFSIWLIAGLISFVLMLFSPNRYEFMNDIRNWFMSETLDMVTVILILYIVMPLSIPQVIKTYRK
jgi:hypothetical protein